jgi:hypothetical protein
LCKKPKGAALNAEKLYALDLTEIGECDESFSDSRMVDGMGVGEDWKVKSERGGRLE